jgi:hypothetical protein
MWGKPHVDLFATRENAKLPTFVSPLPDALAWKQDALSFPWTGLWAYAFPPFNMVATVLQKMRDHPCEVILVAPRWPAQAWFPELLDLLVDQPFLMPLLPYLLCQPDSNVVHQRLEVLDLRAWRSSSLPSRNRVSLTAQPAS